MEIFKGKLLNCRFRKGEIVDVVISPLHDVLILSLPSPEFHILEIPMGQSSEVILVVLFRHKSK